MSGHDVHFFRHNRDFFIDTILCYMAKVRDIYIIPDTSQCLVGDILQRSSYSATRTSSDIKTCLDRLSAKSSCYDGVHIVWNTAARLRWRCGTPPTTNWDVHEGLRAASRARRSRSKLQN